MANTKKTIITALIGGIKFNPPRGIPNSFSFPNNGADAR